MTDYNCTCNAASGNEHADWCVVSQLKRITALGENCNLKDKIMTTEEWKIRHQKHLGPTMQFATESFYHPHEKWIRLCCPCGAKHLTDETNK